MKYNFDKIINRENSNSVKYDFRDKYFGTKDIMPLWVADMDFATPPFVIEALKKRLEHPILAYSIHPDTFHQSVINWCKRRYNWNIKKEWIVLTPGVVPALAFATLGLTQIGDKIIAQPPVYFPFFNTIKDNGRQLIENPLKLNPNNNYEFDFEDLKSKIDRKTKMLFLCSPHNPVGRVWTKNELKQLTDICLENNIKIVSDEIHADLILPGHIHTCTSLISKEVEQNTITTIAPSKTFNLSGLSTAITIIPNDQMRSRFMQQIENMHLWMGNLFGILAAETAYKYGDEWLDELNEYIEKNYLLTKEYFKSYIPEIKVMKLEGTYLVWLNCKALNMNNEELKNFFIKKAKVGLNPGFIFGTGGDGFMRINIACPTARLEQALENISNAVQELTNN